jgi:predicted metalloprotease with PDZ domain
MGKGRTDYTVRSRRFFCVLSILSLIHYGCAVTGPRVTRQEEDAARGQIKQADYRIWWEHQKRLFRISDRFAWEVKTPGAPYRNAIGVLPVLRKSASSYQLGLYEALGNPPDGTVLHVSVGSPAERAGIEEGDVIVAIDDKNVSVAANQN